MNTLQLPLFDIQYSDNKGYRDALRTAFSMRTEVVDEDHLNHLDQETADEQNYDEQAAFAAMETVYQSTKNYPLFQELHELAAALMFSTDPQIGIAVLFSYDYLYLYYPLLIDLMTDSTKIIDSNPHYITLKNKIA